MLMVSKISPRQVVALMAKGEVVQFVDARGEPRWAEASEQVTGAVRVRPASVVRDATSVSHNCKVVVYGTDDSEAGIGRVADQLRFLGYTHVHILDGGFAAWRAANGPVQRKEAAVA